jgi:hypothetical protein
MAPTPAAPNHLRVPIAASASADCGRALDIGAVQRHAADHAGSAPPHAPAAAASPSGA